MSKRLINPDRLAAPIGYSYGVEVTAGRLLILAGQVATNDAGEIVAGANVVAQFEQTLANLKIVVEAAGGQLTDVVKLNIFLTDRDAYKANLKAIGQVYRSFFGKYYPAMTLVEVKRLFDDAALIEIEGWAVIGA
jgi:enamine deaminase RidA (YjgF/YER057c/UK114 family)